MLPLFFMLLGGAEVTRAMWLYSTVASAVKSGVRYSIVHGEQCAQVNPNCANSIGDVVKRIQLTGLGLDQDLLELRFSANGVEMTCASLRSCLSNSTTWPPPGKNAPGTTITILGIYPFRSVMMLAGANPILLSGKASETIQF
jgi:hypothetical protein